MLLRSFSFSRILAFVLAGQALASSALAESTLPDSKTLRNEKTVHIALIDGVKTEGGASVGYYLGSDTLLKLSYLEEENLFINEYSSQSRSFDLGVQQFLGNSVYASLAFRRMKTDSTNNNDHTPQILLWQTDNFARLAVGNQWQLMEGVTVGFEWINLGAHLQRLQHSSRVDGFYSNRDAQHDARRDEKKANRFFYSGLNLELGYSF